VSLLEVEPAANQEDFDSQWVAILHALAVEAAQSPLRDISLARLSKRAGLRQSTLRRYLTMLEDAGIVRMILAEDGRGRAALTEAGRAMLWASSADDVRSL
jgi:DNA-binding transcriptional ArsR family regulator